MNGAVSLLVVDPIAKGLHPGGELLGVLNQGTRGRVASQQPPFIDVDVNEAFGRQA